ncbi:PAS domain-containing sensor histidine kinase [Desulfoferula mesophila]|uniref:PAS domain-containing sensor histidine kinase n=1 Tax=Desulfoferula mesophila TaxID=3058419 RepID=UPI0030D171CB
MSVNPGQAKDQFKAHYVELLQSRLGVGFAVGVVLVPLFAVVDWRLARPFFGLFLSLRLGAAAVMALLWLINRRRSGQAWQEGLTIAGALTVAVMLETMLVAMGGTGSNYYAGLTLLLIAAIVLIPIRLGVAVCLAASVLLVYLVPLAIADTPLLGGNALLHNTGTLFSASMLLLGANWLHRAALLGQFKLRAQVQERERQLDTLNASLEEKVASRTAQLAHSEARYRSLVDSNPQLIYTLDNEGTYSFVGPRVGRLMGYRPEEMLGKYFIAFVRREDHRHCVRAFKQVRDLGLVLEDVEYRVIRADGEERIFLSYTAPLVDDQGKVNGMIGTAVDVTRQRALTAELVKAEDQERRRIARDLHDGVGQYLAVSKLQLSKAAESAEGRERERLTQVQALLDQAIADTRSLTARLSPRVLDEIGLAPALEWLAEQGRERYGLEVEFCCTDEVEVHDGLLRGFLFRAVSELLLNCAKHAKARRVEIAMSRDERALNLSVGDDGIGFDPAQHVNSGTGLGLFSLHERLDLLGGKLEISSPSRGGSLACLTVPLATVAKAGKDADDQPHTSG